MSGGIAPPNKATTAGSSNNMEWDTDPIRERRINPQRDARPKFVYEKENLKRSCDDSFTRFDKALTKSRKTNSAISQSMLNLADPIPTSNSFENLQDDDRMLIPNITSKLPNPKLNNNKQQHQRMPKPIILRKSSNEQVKNHLAALNIKCNSSKVTNTSTYQIFPNNTEEKKKLLERFKQQEIEFHTYSEPSERHEVFILKNHARVELEVLLQLLKDEKLPVTSVSFAFDPKKKKAFAPRNPRPNHHDDPDPVYKVFFEKGSITFSELQQKHRFIEHFKVRWEKVNVKTKKASQCHRCQSWGHSSLNCNRAPRCVKCLESHEVGNCKRKTTEGDPSCVNCGKVGHISSSYECDVYKRYAARTRRSSQRYQQQQQQHHQEAESPAPATSSNQRFGNGSQAPASFNQSNFNVSAKTYATVLSDQASRSIPFQSSLTGAQGPSGNAIFDVFEEFKQIPNINETMRRFSELVQKLKQTPNHNDRLGLMIHYTIASS